MSFADHIRRCNNFDPAARRAADGRASSRSAGCAATTPRRSPAFPRCSRSSDDRVDLARARAMPTRSAPRSTRWSRRWSSSGACRNGATRPSTSMPRWGDKPIFRLDRGAVPFFGVRAYGVHLNGYRRDGDALSLWIGRRAPDKRVVARQARQHRRRRHRQRPRRRRDACQGSRGGGRRSRRELIARRGRRSGAVTYRMETELGIRDDVMFVYDLEVPADFAPHNSDGEIVAVRADAGRRRCSNASARPTTSSSTSTW